jgi:hypothetical protein
VDTGETDRKRVLNSSTYTPGVLMLVAIECE